MKVYLKFLAAVSDYTGVYKTELELDDGEYTFNERIEVIKDDEIQYHVIPKSKRI